MAGTLPTSDYPFVKELAPAGDPDKPKEVKSLRSTKPSWNKVGAKSQLSASRSANGRVLMFVAGGATYSEMRIAYEVAAAAGREVILGASAILTPTVYIDQLKGLSKPVTLSDLQGGALNTSMSALADGDARKSSKRRPAPRETTVHRETEDSQDSMNVKKGGIRGWFNK